MSEVMEKMGKKREVGGFWLLSFFDENSLWKSRAKQIKEGGIKNEDGKSSEWLSMILKASSGPLMKD